MSIYRDDDAALVLRLDEADRRVQALTAERDALRARYLQAQAAVERDEQRLAVAGDGGGAACARRDRAALMPTLLLIAGFLCVPLVFAWAQLVQTDITVVPVLLVLGVPGALAAAVAWPYRKRRLIALLTGVGLLLAALPLIALTLFGVYGLLSS